MYWSLKHESLNFKQNEHEWMGLPYRPNRKKLRSFHFISKGIVILIVNNYDRTSF